MYADRQPQMPWRAERAKGHGPDCVCESCFLAPPLPTMAENLDALTEMAATLRRIENLLQAQPKPKANPPPSPPTPPPPHTPDAPDFL